MIVWRWRFPTSNAKLWKVCFLMLNSACLLTYCVLCAKRINMDEKLWVADKHSVCLRSLQWSGHTNRGIRTVSSEIEKDSERER